MPHGIDGSMTGIIGYLKDAQLILKTDRRFWAAGGFLCIVVCIWMLTDTWREPVPEPEPYKRRARVEEEDFRLALTDFHAQVQKDIKNRAELSDTINRTAGDLESNKQKIDWHVNTLVDKLNSMTSKIDKIAREVGERRIERAKLNQKLANQKKNVKRIRKVDPAEL